MPSSQQVVPVVVLFDYLLSDTGVGMSGQRVTVVLNSTAPATSVSPPTVIAQVQQSTTTDGNGYWQFSLVPNTNISPANTTYTVLTPAGTYDVTLGAVGPYQSTALGTIVNVPVPLSAPAASSIPSLLVSAGEPGIDTVGAGALLLGDNNATSVEIGSGAVPININGQIVATSSTGMQVNAAGDISARSLTLSASSPYLPSARTGATNGLVYDTGGAVVNVQAAKYTAIGTWSASAGTGNASQAIQTALTDAAGGVAYAPFGTYMLGPYYQTGGTTEVCLGIPDNTLLLGAGMGAVFKLIANADNAHSLWMLMGTNNFNSGAGRVNVNCSVQSILFDGNKANQSPAAGVTHSGIVFWPVTNHYISGVIVQNLAAAAGVEHFGILANGDTVGNDTSVNRVNGLISDCQTLNCGSGFAIHGLLGEQVINCTAGQDTNWMGYTVWAGPGLRTRDVSIVGCLADGCQVGFELESCMGVKVVGCTSRANQSGGIRLTASAGGTAAQRCVIVGNEVYNNNSGNSAGFQGAGIFFWRVGGGDPTDNIVMGNRCYDDQGAGQTQLYGIGLDPAMTAGSQNYVRDNHCRGNKTANTIGFGSPYQNITQSVNLNLAVAAAVPTGMTSTFVVDADSIIVISIQGVVAWDAGTGNGALNDFVQADLRIDTTVKISNQMKCMVAATGQVPISLTWAQTLAAGSHTLDMQIANQTGARGLFTRGNITAYLHNGLQ